MLKPGQFSELIKEAQVPSGISSEKIIQDAVDVARQKAYGWGGVPRAVGQGLAEGAISWAFPAFLTDSVTHPLAVGMGSLGGTLGAIEGGLAGRAAARARADAAEKAVREQMAEELAIKNVIPDPGDLNLIDRIRRGAGDMIDIDFRDVVRRARDAADPAMDAAKRLVSSLPPGALPAAAGLGGLGLMGMMAAGRSKEAGALRNVAESGGREVAGDVIDPGLLQRLYQKLFGIPNYTGASLEWLPKERPRLRSGVTSDAASSLPTAKEYREMHDLN